MKKIKEVCAITGVTRRTLQEYNQIGLLKPTDKTEEGHWLYGYESIERLSIIQAYVDAGYLRKEIKDKIEGKSIYDDELLEDVYCKLATKRDYIEKQMKKIQLRKQIISYVKNLPEKEFLKAVEGGKKQIDSNVSLDSILDDMVKEGIDTAMTYRLFQYSEELSYALKELADYSGGKIENYYKVKAVLDIFRDIVNFVEGSAQEFLHEISYKDFCECILELFETGEIMEQFDVAINTLDSKDIENIKKKLKNFRLMKSELKKYCEARLKDIYGTDIPVNAKKRVADELKCIDECGASDIYLLMDVYEKFNIKPELISFRGSLGNSYILYLCGITGINPFDYNLSYEILFGMGDAPKKLSLDINIPSSIREQADNELKKINQDTLVKLMSDDAVDSISKLLKCSKDKEIVFGGDISDEFIEKVKMLCFSYGADAYEGNARELIDNGIITLKEAISSRDDVFDYCVNLGINRQDSYRIMECVRLGRANHNRSGIRKREWKQLEKILVDMGASDWFLDFCKKVNYLFPKAQGISYVRLADSLQKITTK